MSNVDLSNKAMYDMLNDNITEELPVELEFVEAPVKAPVQVPVKVPVQAPVQVPVKAPVQVQVQAPVKHKKMVRSLKGFVTFSLIVILIAAFIYFTVYRLGWGVTECMNKNYHDCAALLTPELAPLAATGLLALL